MVENTGKTLRADTYKPVNTPQALQVEESAAGMPLVVKMKRRRPSFLSKTNGALTTSGGARAGLAPLL